MVSQAGADFSQARQIPFEQHDPDNLSAMLWVDVFRGTDDADEYKAIMRDAFMHHSHTGFLGIHCPTLAQVLPTERMLFILERAYDEGLLFSGPYSTAPFTGTINSYPEHILRHPRYHALWQRPGMPGLAAARRANGKTAGLPLPMIDGAVSNDSIVEAL